MYNEDMRVVKPKNVADTVYVGKDMRGRLLTLKNLRVQGEKIADVALLFSNDIEKMDDMIKKFGPTSADFSVSPISFDELKECCIYGRIGIIYDGKNVFNLDPRTLN